MERPGEIARKRSRSEFRIGDLRHDPPGAGVHPAAGAGGGQSLMITLIGMGMVVWGLINLNREDFSSGWTWFWIALAVGVIVL
jgi:hypothetical protein